ncbi:MAG TPA: LanC-like protein [Gaiellaceae bacterium]|nr:LanC-like protein [Gaiellaceae bacterium]
MTELWHPSEHEALAGEEWSDEAAEQAIAAIVADAEAAFDGKRWPFHPADEPDDSPNDIYLGVAGMAWALHELGSSGWADAVLGALERYPHEPDGAPEYSWAPSYLGGECGIALVGYRLTGDAGLADRVHKLVLANLEDEWNEMLWGASGSLLAAEAMLAWTGEVRWETAWDALADKLEAARDDDGLWTQHRLGEWRYYGVGHGFAGNELALSHRREVDVDAVLARLALRDGPLANWPPAEGAPPERLRVQWCHGAPGIVAGLGHVMDEELALAGGELTWQAGPLAKGSGLCHGTAGNGYAFLVLHRRTGDELWRDRARAFAMHAIGQVEREREKLGRGRYSLFTGDLGVALLLRHLRDGDDRFPTLGPFTPPRQLGR